MAALCASFISLYLVKHCFASFPGTAVAIIFHRSASFAAAAFDVERANELKSLNDELEACGDEGAIVAVLTRELAKLEGAKSEERKAAADAAAQRAANDGSESEAKSEPWDDEDEVKTLDKACNQKFPMGTKDRWERVAEYMCEHGKRVRSAKEVMTRYKAGL